MSTSLIRSDARGLHVRTGGYVFRPGAIRGHGHVLRMDDVGLAAGDRVKARHRGGTPLARIVLDDGTTTHWAEEATLVTDGVDAPEDAVWLPSGGRDTSGRRIATGATGLPREIEALDGDDVISCVMNGRRRMPGPSRETTECPTS